MNFTSAATRTRLLLSVRNSTSDFRRTCRGRNTVYTVVGLLGKFENCEHHLLSSSRLPVVCHTVRPSGRLCVCLSAWINSTLTRRIFMKLHFSIFRKSVEKSQSSLKSYKSNGYLTQTTKHVFDHISLSYT
jgi:hypothetical protein